MAMQQPKTRDFDAPAIPDRLYFKIGDVARICSVEAYVLRFWETQFPQLKPNKSGTGQRLYRRRDVELALKIKQLVHGEGYTISGARQVLEQAHSNRPMPQPVVLPQSQPPQSQPEVQRDSQPQLTLLEASTGPTPDSVAATIAHARAELREIASLLASPEPQPSRRRPRLVTMPAKSELLFPSF
jgi:DNA-binding transcriptional MerR regulator